MKAVFAALAAAALCAPLPAAAQDRLMLDTGRIDRALQDFVEQGRVKGASVLVWQGGREAHFNAEGMADAEAG